MTNQIKQVLSSFRDPSGNIYYKDNVLLRKVNFVYQDNYDFLMNSGLYEKLVSSGLMVSHIEVENNQSKCYKIIQPQKIPFISYPYEWCFSQLKHAALLTLEIQKLALDYGMSLKDCSAYNVQFVGYKPVFIDTLSFERYIPNKPWVCYKQFCQHFLVPLSLMAFKDIELGKLLKSYIDGLPLYLAVSLLPLSCRFKPGFLLHIYAHAKAQHSNISNILQKKENYKFNLNSFYALIDSLISLIQRIRWKKYKSQWGDYYEKKESYSHEAMEHKKQIVKIWINKIKPKMACDLGSNIGLFSRIASKNGCYTVSTDFDPFCVEYNYQQAVTNKEENILPLVLDIYNPTPALGWENKEWLSFIERGPFDLIIALALIHHLAISNNLSLRMISDFFKKICRFLIIEFVPKEDKMVKDMLSLREDIFIDYCKENFEEEFTKYFIINEVIKIKNSERTLYLMQRKD